MIVVRDFLPNISSSNYTNNLIRTAIDRGGQDKHNETLPLAVNQKHSKQHPDPYRRETHKEQGDTFPGV